MRTEKNCRAHKMRTILRYKKLPPYFAAEIAAHGHVITQARIW